MYFLAGYDFEANLHLYNWQDLNILLDVNSGAVHILDEVAYDLVENMITYRGDFYRAMEIALQKFSKEEVKTATEELLDVYYDNALFSEPEDIFVDMTQMKVKALCLNIAHACNMKCSYCFASQGDFGLKPGLMPLATGKKAIDFLVAASADIKNLEVDFFGGEPLLNFAVVKDLVLYGRELEKTTDKQFNFTLTTNGTLLDESIMDFIIAHDISIVLSLDGRPEVNDRNRVLNDGSGTYAAILPNFKKMINKNPNSYYIRGTFTRDNMDFSQDLKHIVDLGFNSLSLEPAVGIDNEFAIKADDLPQVLKEYEELTEVLLSYHEAGQPVHFFHYNLNLQKGPCLAKRQTGCGAGVEYLVVTPEGDIYPCHQFVGKDYFLMGNVDDMVLNASIKQLFASSTIEAKEECLNCWARNYCGGGCHANNFQANGSFEIPDSISCNMHKKRIEGAIFLELKKQG